jgi:hypothetical protein
MIPIPENLKQCGFCANIRMAKDDMGDDLCKYCPLEKKGVYGVDGGYMAGCEGSRCDDAYENYLESVGE